MAGKRKGKWKRGSPLPDLLKTGDAAEVLGLYPPLLGFTAHMAGVPRTPFGTSSVITRAGLYALRDFLARVDPGGVFWDPRALPEGDPPGPGVNPNMDNPIASDCLKQPDVNA